MKAITAITLHAAVAECRPCMNPASIIWPAWREPEAVSVQLTVRSRRIEAAIVILNPDDGDNRRHR